MKLGMAHPMGPLRLADFIGLDTCVHIMEVMAEGLNNPRYRACPLLKQLVTAGRLGDKTKHGVFKYE
jgi:3-hydroxybutyryl-CoA dehydrogenase